MDKRRGKSIVRSRTSQSQSRTSTLSLQQLFDIFIQSKLAEGCSDRTIADHRKHFRYFSEWLTTEYADITIEDITPTVIRQWITYMLERRSVYDNHPFLKPQRTGLSVGTVNIRLRSVKCMFRFLADESLIPTDPTQRIKVLKTPDKGLESLTSEQVQLLLAQPDDSTYAGFRDKTLMMLLLDCGLRINEALSLKQSDFDAARAVITVPATVAKTRKLRQVPLSKHVVRSIVLLINDVQTHFPDQELLFLSNYGEQLAANNFRHRLADYARQANITNVRVTPHRLRHTFAKLYCLNGGDPFSLQRIMGHADMQMVKRYVTLSQADVTVQHNNFSPINAVMGNRRDRGRIR